ncbi:hypothetical protein [Enterococcus sp. HY326]|nr:hypothetical protein [Enterococcus sp. HY326]
MAIIRDILLNYKNEIALNTTFVDFEFRQTLILKKREFRDGY